VPVLFDVCLGVLPREAPSDAEFATAPVGIADFPPEDPEC